MLFNNHDLSKGKGDVKWGLGKGINLARILSSHREGLLPKASTLSCFDLFYTCDKGCNVGFFLCQHQHVPDVWIKIFNAQWILAHI